MKERIHILAGNYREFDRFYMDNKEFKKDYVYVSDVHKIIGCFVEKYYVIGTFWSRRDAGEIFDEVNSRLKNKALLDSRATKGGEG